MEKIKVGAREEAYTRPSEVECREVVTLWSTSPQRAALSALGLCTRVGRLSNVDKRKFNGSQSEYALAIAEELPRLKLKYVDAINAGNECFRLICESLISEDEVKQAEGNSSETEDSP